MIERGTLPGQRTLVATLADVAERAADAGVRAPGDDARRRRGGAARARSPGSSAARCTARTVAVTRARAQASALAARLRALGAAVVEAPGHPHARRSTTSCRRSRGYDLVCVTSPNGATELFARLSARGSTRARWPGARVAAIGPGTARAPCASTASGPTSCPSARWPRGSSRRSTDVPVRRALVVRGREGRDVLPDALRERGAEVDVAARSTRRCAEPLDDAARAAAPRRRLRRRSPRASTVRFFPAAAGEEALGGPAARVDRPGDQRGAARARRRAATSRPTRTRRTGWSRRSWPTPRRAADGSDPPGGAVPARRDRAAGSLEPELVRPRAAVAEVEGEGLERGPPERPAGRRLGAGLKPRRALAAARK